MQKCREVGFGAPGTQSDHPQEGGNAASWKYSRCRYCPLSRVQKIHLHLPLEEGMAKDPRFPGFFQPGSPNVLLIILTDFTCKK